MGKQTPKNLFMPPLPNRSIAEACSGDVTMSNDLKTDREQFAKRLDQRWGNRLRPAQAAAMLHRKFMRKVDEHSRVVSVFAAWGSPRLTLYEVK